MRRFFTFTLLLLIPALLFSQSKQILLPGGKIMNKSDEARVVKKQIMEYRGSSNSDPYDVVQGVTGTLDTLYHRAWDGSWGSTFGFQPQDVMVQWFEAPTEILLLVSRAGA